jgi:two-component system response regulator HydG
MIGQSAPMRRIMSLIERVASSDAPVLITGETGTGKGDTARLIHELSRRRGGPYVAVNCAAIAPALVESELFGHEKGAFTGADRRREGLFESANHGTLLLDEFAEMRCETQAKLLRVIEELKVLPVGGTREIPTDVRVLAASNLPIDRLLRTGQLREDLYYRLNVCRIHLPPLRERIEDLPLLIDYFIGETNERHRRGITGVDDECLTALARYRWPGNIRQLKHVIEGAAVFCNSARFTVNDLPAELRAPIGPDSSFVVHLPCSAREVMDELVWRTVEREGNKSRAARVLGVNRRTVHNHLERHDDYRTSGNSNSPPYRNGNGRLS